MSDYTPTTEEVERASARYLGTARFYAWLAEYTAGVVREAEARALEEAGGDVEGIKNAARNGMNEFGPYPWHAAEGVSAWLRARAAEIRERKSE